MKVIAHLGVHKTATTSFQSLVKREEKNLLSQGYVCLGIHTSNSEKYLLWRMEYMKILLNLLRDIAGGRSDVMVLHQRDLIDKFVALKSLVPLDKGFILSDENILGPMTGHKSGPYRCEGFYPAHEYIIDALLKAFGDEQLTMILVRRNLYDWLISAYKDLVAKMRFTVGPEVFAAGITANTLHQYNSLFKCFRQMVGEQGFIFDYDKFHKDQFSAPVALLCEKLGVLFDTAGNVERFNKSLNWAQVEFILRVADLAFESSTRAELLRFVYRNYDDKSPSASFQQRVAEFEARLRSAIDV